MINELFPKTDYVKLQYDEEGLYSITNSIDADIISKLILDNFTNKDKLNILDGTGGLGGNTFSFSKYFENITTIEINHQRYNMLMNNIETYELTNINVLNMDSIEYLLSNYLKYNIYFFDPPWGGVNYKKHINLSLTIGNKTLPDIALFLKEHTTNKLLIFKLPFNYNFKEFYEYNYKLYKIKNYYIIIILF